MKLICDDCGIGIDWAAGESETVIVPLQLDFPEAVQYYNWTHLEYQFWFDLFCMTDNECMVQPYFEKAWSIYKKAWPEGLHRRFFYNHMWSCRYNYQFICRPR